MALERCTVFVMSLACAVNVANLYYCQPLLSSMGRSLGVPDRAIGYLPMWTQAGTALGMFCFVPLGDLLPRRPLIVVVTLAGSLSAILMALAPRLTLVNAAGFATGLTAIVSHLILPFSAKLAEPERRGHVLGTILGGLLLGILLARVVSGYIGDLFGWRTVYWLSAAAWVAMAAGIGYALPQDYPENRIGYGELLGSIVHLARTQPVLREAAITGGMLF
jgi:predicted MFS family arabinose efflux permease